MTYTHSYTYSHSVTFISDNIIKCLKDIVRECGLDPANMINDYDVLMRGIKTWLQSGHLILVALEIYHPKTDKLIKRWDLKVQDNWSSDEFVSRVDTDQILWAIKKQGVIPSSAKYEIKVRTKHGRQDVDGWSTCKFRSTDDMVQQGLGRTADHSGLGFNTTLWR